MKLDFTAGSAATIETRGFPSSPHDEFGFVGAKLDTPNRTNRHLLGARLDHFELFPHGYLINQVAVKKPYKRILDGYQRTETVIEIRNNMKCKKKMQKSVYGFVDFLAKLASQESIWIILI